MLTYLFSRPYLQELVVMSDSVLILVLVEHTLGGVRRVVVSEGKLVLILVLVEHTLGDRFFGANKNLSY